MTQTGHVKGLSTRNIHKQYESPMSSGLKVMAKVKVFCSRHKGDAYISFLDIFVPAQKSKHNFFHPTFPNIFVKEAGRKTSFCLVTLNSIVKMKQANQSYLRDLWHSPMNLLLQRSLLGNCSHLANQIWKTYMYYRFWVFFMPPDRMIGGILFSFCLFVCLFVCLLSTLTFAITFET